jgi:hypothetical protein
MKYEFLVESYETERVKVLSVWSEFKDEDLPVRPNPTDPRGRSVHEHMVHQCVSEDVWFRTMLDVDVGAPPLPEQERRLEFIRRYAEDSARRLALLRGTDDGWWEAQTPFFDVRRSKAWVMTRRLESHVTSSRPANGHAAYVGSRSAQQLRADRGYRRPDAESRADHLCVCECRRASERRE